MKFDNFKVAFKHKSKGLSIYFFMLFFSFSLIVSILGYLFSQYLLSEKNNLEIKQNLKVEFKEKKERLDKFVKSQHYFLDAAINNDLIIPYTKDPNKYKKQLQRQYLSIASTSASIMQIRYLDKKGDEKIKIIRKKYSDTPFLVKNEELQNKSNRYYFKQMLEKSNQDKVVFSKIDLNMEHGKIEYPIVPTIRVSKAVVVDGVVEGVVILNLFMEEFLKDITNSLYFKVGIIDGNKEYIVHFNDPAKNWSSYFDQRVSFAQEYCLVDDMMLDENDEMKNRFFIKDIDNIIPSNNLKFVFMQNETAFKQIRSIQKKYIIYFILFTFMISIPISILLSRVPFRYTKKLIDNKHQLLEIIDDNVLYSSSDLKGNITDVSNALCKLTKYDRGELMGKSHNIFRHHETPEETFQSMWSTILNGNVWKGEIKNVDKDHEVFWIDVTITPNFNSSDEVVGFTAIRKNITERKIIEALSVTDELTTLYNKRSFNKTFPKEIKRAKRLKTNFVFVILDIDNFKLYNDTYGHKEGDNVLQEVGVLIRKMFKRSYDFAFRIGGEEFAVIFTEKDISKIEPYIEQLRKSIAELNILHERNADHGRVTTSIGYRIVDANTNLTEEEIYTQADEALYIAKSRGRNMYINYEDIVDK